MIFGTIEFLILVVLAVLGVPIALALFMVGIGAAWLYYGSLAGAYLAGISAWSNTLSWSLTMLPLFILMGGFASFSGIGRDAFDCFYKWFVRLRGSLAIVATVTSALFGAITGSTTATIAAIGSISLPEMQKLGYSASLRTGAVAVAGLLANLIPPSILAVVYCEFAEESVGRVFMAGLIPGIILTIFFCITIYIWGWINPGIAPVTSESFSVKEKFTSLRLLIPIILIFLLIIGGIYTGTFSPTEAAGIGCILMIIMLLAMRRLTWGRFVDSMRMTVRIVGFIMLLIIGGRLFGYTITLSGFSADFTGAILGLGLPPVGLMFAIVGAIILLGCFLEGLTMLVLIIPLFLPAVKEMGFDYVWFGTVSVMLVELGAITPPVASVVWVTQSVDPSASIGDVTRGVFPFYAATLLLMVLLVFFPQIALWLPSMMF